MLILRSTSGRGKSRAIVRLFPLHSRFRDILKVPNLKLPTLKVLWLRDSRGIKSKKKNTIQNLEVILVVVVEKREGSNSGKIGEELWWWWRRRRKESCDLTNMCFGFLFIFLSFFLEFY